VPELPDLGAMREALASAGFTDIEFADISWNVAPSIAHVPWVAGGSLFPSSSRAAAGFRHGDAIM